MKKIALAMLATTLILGACGSGDSGPQEHEAMSDYLLSQIDADEMMQYCSGLRVSDITVREDNPKGATMLQIQERLQEIQQGTGAEAARLRTLITPDVDIEKVYEHMVRSISALCA